MTTEAPVEPVDADVIDEHPEPRREPVTTTTALSVRERRSEVIRPLDTAALVDSFRAYQELLPQLLTADDYQAAGQGKRFVTKSGWRKIAAAFDLDVQILRSEVDRDFTGQPLRAEVWARAISPSGRAMDGDGYCAVDEERFNDPRGRQKLENDLRTTATTRAMNRAISGLIGMGDEADSTPAAPGLDPCSPQLHEAVMVTLGYLLDGDATAAEQFIPRLVEQFGSEQLPAIAGQTITLVARAVKDHREALAAAAA